MLAAMTTAVSLQQKLSTFSDLWSPKIVNRFNGHDIMVVKVESKFNWHSHADNDDFFLILKGNIVIRQRDGEIRLGPGDLYVVPQGVEHRPLAEEEANLPLIGKANTTTPAIWSRQ